jgi:hypothetical protein
VPRRATRAARELYARQREAADRLRREVLGADGSLAHPYFRALNRRIRRPPAPATRAELEKACAAADLVWVGDFHAIPENQQFVAGLLAALRAVGPLALGVEFVYTRQQRLLDRRQAGSLDDDAFLRRIHYREEWGYPWGGYGELLDRARRLGVPVFALDAPPRGGFEGLARRDEHAARRIAAIVADDPERRLLVLFGESHLAPTHLPRRVRSRLAKQGIAREEVTIYQDPDPAYWHFIRIGESVPGFVRFDDGSYAAFHTTPLAKYEAYRQVLERWREDVPPEEEVDLTPAVHHLIGVLLGWLGIDPRRFRVRHGSGWEEDLADAFPEVYSGPEVADLLAPILEDHGRSAEEVREARALLHAQGALYEPRSNALFLLKYLPGRAAGEGARFLRAVLSGRLFAAAVDSPADPVARAYGAAFNEALVGLGSRLVDPASGAAGGASAGVGAAAAGAALVSAEDAGARARWIEAHAKYEASGASRAPADLLAPLRGSRETRRRLARDLGRRLAAVLFERVRTGRLGARELKRLFSRGIDPGQAQRTVVALLRGGSRD